MDFATFQRAFEQHARLGELGQYGRVVEQGREYPLLRLVVPGDRWLTITAVFHGDEKAGGLTLVEHLPELVDLARSRGVGLRVYPCLNPSGFEANTRYNMTGEQPNNDFLRYEVAPGKWIDELGPDDKPLRWILWREGPKETRALLAELERHPPPAASLDIHQDPYHKGPASYAYVFGALDPYLPLVAECERHAPIARGVTVDENLATDRHGLIAFHDGSITDYFWRRGTPYTAALETTTDTSMAACHAVNLIWLKAFVELAADLRRPTS